jgi:hypothetical protein
LVGKLKSCAGHFECDAHDLLGLGIEFGTVQKLRDGHNLPHHWQIYADPRVILAGRPT